MMYDVCKMSNYYAYMEAGDIQSAYNLLISDWILLDAIIKKEFEKSRILKCNIIAKLI